MLRNASTVVLSLCAAAISCSITGCGRYYRVDYAPTPAHQAHYDEAMALRDWKRSTAYYGSGDTIAGPTNANTHYDVGEYPDDSMLRRQRLAVIVEPLIGLGNIVAMPVSLILDPPTEQRRYEATVVDPTYTAAVPLSELANETPESRRAAALFERQQQREAPGERVLPGQQPAGGAGSPR